jgi:hypothetical protein
MTRPIIGSAYDPRKRHRLDQDAELVQKALNPGYDTRGPIPMPRWSLDGFIFTAIAMAAVTLVIVWVGSMIN